MANSEHLAILKQGVEVWNQWRKDQPEVEPNLKGANLKNLNLESINFNRANLIGTNFTNTILINAHFKEAKLGLNSKLFLIVFLTILSIEIYFYHLGFLFTLTVYLITLLLCLLRNFTANNKPFLPNSENLVSQSERKLWQINKTNHHIDYKKFRSSTATAINNLFYVSLFSFIPLLSIAGWLEPSLRLFSDNGMLNTPYFFSALVVTFYLGFLGTIGFDINKLLRWLFFTIVHTSKFNNADLTDADFSFARITNADFNNAILTRTNLYNVKGIKQIRIDQNYIHILKPLILNLILYRKAKNLDLEGVDLSELNLSNTNFSHSNLAKVQLIGSNLKNCTLTGACIEDWNKNPETKLDNVTCDYVYLQKSKNNRYPKKGKLDPGEFTKIFGEIDNTVELVFRHGINWRAFAYTFNESNIQIYNTSGEELFLRKYKALGDGLIVLEVKIPYGVDKEKTRDDLIHKYEIQIAKLKGKVEAKDEMLAPLYERLLLPQAQINQTVNYYNKMFETEKRLILQIIADEFENSNSINDNKISKILNLDLHKVREILIQLKSSGYIKSIEKKQHQDPNAPKIALVLITEITPKGYLALKEEIPINDDRSHNSAITINNGNIGIGHMSGGEIKDNAIVAGIHNEADRKELNQLLQNIIGLLHKLEQTYNSDTTTGRMTIATKAIEHIEQDANLANRVFSALEKGGTAWLEAKLINPSASCLIAALKDWQKNKRSKN